MDTMEMTSSGVQENESEISQVGICRICLAGNVNMQDLFRQNQNSGTLSAKITSFSSVKVIPNDGLPSQICCECAVKLESAYEFKLQIEQADDYLRSKFDSILNVKEEIFFSAVEVDLAEVHRNNTVEDMETDDYIGPRESGLLKDHLALLQVQKLDQASKENSQAQEESMQSTIKKQEDFMQIPEFSPVNPEHEEDLPEEYPEDVPHTSEDHPLTDTSLKPEEKPEVVEEKPQEVEEKLQEVEEKPPIEENPKTSNEEETYFENLNLSSRAKQQSEKDDKIVFVCYVCDKPFATKAFLKEHMQSHEEIRHSMMESLMKIPEKADVSPGTSRRSGVKPNKCPICGKEYLYIISFQKHLKQHDEEKSEGMPLEVSFEEEDNALHFDDFDMARDDSEDGEENKKTRVFKEENIEPDFVCTTCQKDFETLDKLNEHGLTHTTDSSSGDKKFKCPNCPMSYLRKRAFTKHLATHKTPPKHECDICDRSFETSKEHKAHMDLHAKTKNFKCTECKKAFPQELTLRNHLISTGHKTILFGQEYDTNKRIKRNAAKAAEKIIDRIKIEDFEDEDDEKKEEEGNEDTEVVEEGPKKKVVTECEKCNKKFVSKAALAKHVEMHVKDEKDGKEVVKMEAEEAEVKAPEGEGADAATGGEAEEAEKSKKRPLAPSFDDDSDDDEDFEANPDWVLDSHECPTCRKRYSTKKSLLRHQLLHEEPNFECDICSAKFYRKDKLKAHYDKCSEKNPDQVRRCNICCEHFENNDLLREHRAKHVTEGILTDEDLKELEPSLDESQSSEKVVRKRRTDIVGLECTECNKRYTSRKGLLRHIQVHEGKRYLCDICPKKFYRREHLKIHVAKHNMVKPFKCNRCPKRFMKEEQLTSHLSKHERTGRKGRDSDAPKRFLCEICSKSFTQSTTLIAHLRAHNGIKPYVCDVCSRPFTTNAYLKMHMRTHTQERPYICQFCSRAFARADTLANHLTSHTGEAKYHCKYCPKNFRRLKSLKEHVFIHTGQRPYACPTCDRKFNNNGSRYAHSKRCKQNALMTQNRVVQGEGQSVQKAQNSGLQVDTKSQSIKTITIERPEEQQQLEQPMNLPHELLMPLILPLTVTLSNVGVEEVILPEGTKIYTTS